VGMSRQQWRAAVAGVAGAAVIAGCSAPEARTAAERPASSVGTTARGEGPAGDRTDEEAGLTYADGTYRADGWYGSLPSSIGVELTVADDVITHVEVTTHATDPTSLDYQQRFADAVAEVVVGRPVDEVHVSKLAGSSGTPEGFNDALDRIKQEASG
jgi:uncharacterized protein with FMN-binding domain